MKEVEPEGCKYLGTVELEKIKENEMKEKIERGYKRRLRLVFKSKLNGKKNYSSEHMGSCHLRIWGWNHKLKRKQTERHR